MIRASVLVLVPEARAAAVGAIMRPRDLACHFATTCEAAAGMLGTRRRIGVLVVDPAVEGGRALGFASLAVAARTGLEVVLLGMRARDTTASGLGRARRVPATAGPEVLVASVEAAVRDANTARQSRLATALAERRLARIQALERRLCEGSGPETTRQLTEANVRLRQSAMGLARLVSVMAEGGDPDLGSRRERVARTAVALGQRVGLAQGDLDDVRLAALLADIGRSWTREGFDLDGAHAERSARAITPLPFSRSVVAAVRHHHERWDGLGSPGGLRGKEIPVLARIISVAESFVTLCEGDDGEDGFLDHEAALALQHEAGRAHDPEIVAALTEMSAEASNMPVPLSEFELVGGLR